MAYEIPGQMVTLAASTDMSALQFRFVTVGSDGRAAKPSAGASVMGVLQNKPTEDQAASIMIGGISKIQATASTLAEGDLCATSTAGEAIPLSAGHYAVGRIVDGSSGGAGRVLSVQIQPVGTT